MNPIDFLIVFITLLLVGLVIYSMRKNKKKNGCAACPHYKAPEKVQIELSKKEPKSKK